MLLLKDMMFNVLAPYSTRLVSQGDNKNVNERRHQIPISDFFSESTVAPEQRVNGLGSDPLLRRSTECDTTGLTGDDGMIH